MKPVLRLLGRSFVEDERLSPRLLTVFAFVLAALWLLWRGAITPPQVQGGIILTAWPPEYIWNGLFLTIAGLLGLGKVVNAWQSKPAAPGTIVQAQSVQADVQVQGDATVNPQP